MMGTTFVSPRRALRFGVLVAVLALAGCRGDAQAPGPKVTPAASSIAEARRGDPRTTEAVPPRVSRLVPAADGASVLPAEVRPLEIPDVTVVDQDGRKLRFYSDLVKGRVVAINFVFTTCKAGCPILGAGFSKFQETLGDRLGKDVSLISISVDPMVDRPQRLKDWARHFHARPGWRFVTAADGQKAELDQLLKALQVYTPEKADHALYAIVVDGDTLEGRTSRKLVSPSELQTMVGEALKIRGGRKYFTDATLIDQDGHTHRFYSDLVRGRVVVINAFFTACKGSCPVLGSTLINLQDRVGDRLGKDVVFLSLTVDPTTDNLEELARYAKHCGARPGWYFLTGTNENLAQVQRKLGQYVENREVHASIMIVGSEASGLWMKHMDPGDADGLYRKVEEAIASSIRHP
jgi:cytochrome oxidase Cu insertion factor (SCO1/SenC/PrrC family)